MQIQLSQPLALTKRPNAPRVDGLKFAELRFEGLKDELAQLAQQRQEDAAAKAREYAKQAQKEEDQRRLQRQQIVRQQEQELFDTAQRETPLILSETFVETSSQGQSTFSGWDLLQEIVQTREAWDVLRLLSTENNNKAKAMLAKLEKLGIIETATTEVYDPNYDESLETEIGHGSAYTSYYSYKPKAFPWDGAQRRLNLETRQWDDLPAPN